MLAWQSDGGKHAIARQPGMIPRLLRLLHSDACVVSWYTAELLGFLSLRDTLLRTILHTAATHHRDASGSIATHLSTFLNPSLPEADRANAAWRVWLASLDPQQRTHLLQGNVLAALQPMLTRGASLASKLAATRILRSVALSSAATPDAMQSCFPTLAGIVCQLVALASDQSQPSVACAAAISAVANLAATGGDDLSRLVLRHGGLEAAQSLMLHGSLPGQRWGARLLAAIVGNVRCAARADADGTPVFHESSTATQLSDHVMVACCRAAVHVLRQPDEQCQEFGCHALRTLVLHSDAARAWLVQHWELDGLRVEEPAGQTCGALEAPPHKDVWRSTLGPRRSSLDVLLARMPTTGAARRCSVDVLCKPYRTHAAAAPLPHGVLPLMHAQSPTVRLHACRLLGSLLQDVAAAQHLLARRGAQEPPTLRALCCLLADPVEGVQAEAATAMLHACRLLPGGLEVHGHGVWRGGVRLLASPCGTSRDLKASFIIRLSFPFNV